MSCCKQDSNHACPKMWACPYGPAQVLDVMSFCPGRVVATNQLYYLLWVCFRDPKVLQDGMHDPCWGAGLGGGCQIWFQRGSVTLHRLRQIRVVSGCCSRFLPCKQMFDT